MVSMAGTISDTSVPGRRKPRRIKSLAISSGESSGELLLSSNLGCYFNLCFIYISLSIFWVEIGRLDGMGYPMVPEKPIDFLES